MAFVKTYQGSSSNDYSNSLAWALASLRNAGYAWTASGSGTAEYYVRTAANANPGFVATPPSTSGVYLNGTSATKGSLGSLAAGTWGYGDNDTLGYPTVYVRTSGGVDPDTLSADYVQFRQIPQAGETVRVPPGAGAVTSGFDQSAVAIAAFIVEEGYANDLGSATLGYLRVAPTILEVNTRGRAWLDTGGTSTTATIHNTGTGDTGTFGVYLRGTAISLADIRGGFVGIAALPGELATVTTLRMGGTKTNVKCGAGVALTTAQMYSGNLTLHCNATTITKYGGNVYLMEASAITTVNSLAGEFHWGSSGNITTYNARGGVFNMKAGNAARTLGTLNRYLNGGKIDHNKEAVTITTNTMQDSFSEQIGA